MFGIFTGMKITLKHFFGPKVTRLYPYEKRVLPPRTRGLIQYVLDEKEQFKCEGCLFCEKICPPQAITVKHAPREFQRDRPLTLPQAVWGNFTRSRRSLLSHSGRPELALDQRAPRQGENAIDWERIGTVAAEEGGLAGALAEIQHTVGYVPRHAVTRLATESGVDLSTVYSLATGLAGLSREPVTEPAVAVCQCPVCRNAGAAEIAAAINPILAGKATLPEKSHPRCLGDIRQAPVMRVGANLHGSLTPSGAEQIVRQYLAGGSPR